MDVNIFPHLILDSYNAPPVSKDRFPALFYEKMYFFVHSGQMFNSAREDLRRHMENEKEELEDKKRTTVHIMVLKEKEYWHGDRQKLLNKEKNLQRKLSITEEKKS